MIHFEKAHEQENKIVKVQVALLDSWKTLLLSGPEMARMLKEFEEEYFTEDDMENPKIFQHHEQGLSSQKSFQKQVNALSATIRQMGLMIW